VVVRRVVVVVVDAVVDVVGLLGFTVGRRVVLGPEDVWQVQ